MPNSLPNVCIISEVRAVRFQNGAEVIKTWFYNVLHLFIAEVGKSALLRQLLVDYDGEALAKFDEPSNKVSPAVTCALAALLEPGGRSVKIES